MNERVARLRGLLAEAGLDALLVSDPYNRRYLSEFTGSAGYLLITRDESVIATDFRYWEQAGQQCPDFRLHKAIGQAAEWFPPLVAPLGEKKLGFEQAHVTYQLHKVLRAAVDSLPAGQRPEMVPAEPLVERLRAVKEPAEVDAMERVIALGDAAFTYVAERAEPGWTEKQVAWEIERYIREHGGEGLSFPTIVAGGAWGALPHAYPRDYELREGEGVVIDMGALLDGYCSDMTRTIFLGRPDDQFRKIYDIVFVAQQAAAEAIESGMKGHDAHMVAQNVIEAAGYAENFQHGLGHGSGLQVHEAPRLGRNSSDVLQDGMVFSIEPGIYLPGWGGVRIEDLAVLESGRCRVLSKAPKLQFAGVGA